jgi:hypothetical protein
VHCKPRGAELIKAGRDRLSARLELVSGETFLS